MKGHNCPERDVLPRMVAEYQKLVEAKALLESIYVELGPYRNREDAIKDETWYKVRDYFGFDDSE